MMSHGLGTKKIKMKKQVRRNVFETNSSSQHSLCMKKNIGDRQDNIKKLSVIADVNNTITLFKTNPNIIVDLYNDIMNISKMDIQKKIDLLSYAAICGPTNEFVKYLCYMRNLLYINYNFNIDLDYDNLDKASNTYFYYGIFKHLSNEFALDQIETFLFTDWCYYTRYDDDCGPMPKEIEEIKDEIYSLQKEDFILIEKRGS